MLIRMATKRTPGEVEERLRAACSQHGFGVLGSYDLRAKLREWCKGRLSVYKIPQRLLVVNELPRNAMGKVTKPAVRALF